MSDGGNGLRCLCRCVECQQDYYHDVDHVKTCPVHEAYEITVHEQPDGSSVKLYTHRSLLKLDTNPKGERGRARLRK